MKGIVLSGGKGSRLYPLTLVVHKGLLPIYDKPMIYYPLATLIDAGIKDILIISTEEYIHMYKNLLGDGRKFGINLTYEIEKESKGTGQALIIAKDFVKNDSICLIYGDNIFFGDLKESLKEATSSVKRGDATIFAYMIDKSDANRFGIVELDEKNNVLSLEEKPEYPKSNYIATGLYIFTNEAIQYSEKLELSERGELEITDVLKKYLEKGKLKAVKLTNNIKWIDAGNKDSLLEASVYAKQKNTHL